MIEQSTLAAYLDALASKAATPGGGASAGVSGAQACALIAMVCRSTRGKKLSSGDKQRIAQIVEWATNTQALFLTLADEDMQTFERVMAAYRLPAPNRSAALQSALKAATQVPLAMVEAAAHMIPCITNLVETGNPNLVTDTGIASLLIDATIRAARLNVLVNLKSINDTEFVAACHQQLADSLAALPALAAVNTAVDTLVSKEPEP